MTQEVRIGPEDILDFWFEGVAGDPAAIAARSRIWFGGGSDFDRLCRERFGEIHVQAVEGGCDAWQETPRGALALVILLDQLSRNIHRGTAAAFSGDARALACCQRTRGRGFDEALRPIERMFLYMPLQHAEDRERQDEALEVWQALANGLDDRDLAGYVQNSLGHVREHRDVVHRFGRFPHRNAVLGRASTPEERQYLEDGAPRYGQ